MAAFALVSLLGLLRVALDSDNAASRDTQLAAMSSHVLNELRDVPFDALWAADPESARDAAPSTGTPVGSTYYFTNEGAPALATDVGKLEVLYKCVVTKTADETTRSVSSGYYNQLKLQLRFSWPVIVDKSNKEIPVLGGSQLIHASIARH